MLKTDLATIFVGQQTLLSKLDPFQWQKQRTVWEVWPHSYRYRRGAGRVLLPLEHIRVERACGGVWFKGSLYYNIKCRPKRHLKAFYLVCRFIEDAGETPAQWFPIRQAWIPCHVPLSAGIIRGHLLKGDKDPPKSTKATWRRALDIHSSLSHFCGFCKFRDKVYTDGVSFCVYQKLE